VIPKLLDLPDIVYVVRGAPMAGSSPLVGIGTRHPSHLTAMGRILLANLEPDAFEAF